MTERERLAERAMVASAASLVIGCSDETYLRRGLQLVLRQCGGCSDRMQGLYAAAMAWVDAASDEERAAAFSRLRYEVKAYFARAAADADERFRHAARGGH